MAHALFERVEIARNGHGTIGSAVGYCSSCSKFGDLKVNEFSAGYALRCRFCGAGESIEARTAPPHH